MAAERALGAECGAVLRDAEMDGAAAALLTVAHTRDLLGLKGGAKDKFQPVALDKYRVFVQSTSYNRKLIGGTGFLYEVDETK